MLESFMDIPNTFIVNVAVFFGSQEFIEVEVAPYAVTGLIGTIGFYLLNER